MKTLFTLFMLIGVFNEESFQGTISINLFPQSKWHFTVTRPRPGFAVLILKDIFRFSHTAFGFSFGFRCPCNSRNWTLPFFRVKPHRNDVLKYLLTFSFQFLTFSRFSFSIFTASSITVLSFSCMSSNCSKSSSRTYVRSERIFVIVRLMMLYSSSLVSLHIIPLSFAINVFSLVGWLPSLFYCVWHFVLWCSCNANLPGFWDTAFQSWLHHYHLVDSKRKPSPISIDFTDRYDHIDRL